MSRVRVAVILLIIGTSLVTMVMRASAAVTVSLEAGPQTIPADGKSRSRVLVTVLDEKGSPVPDGSEVRLTTSAGDITPVAYTSGGRAIAILTSSSCPQIATIIAVVDGTSGLAQVEFSQPSDIDDGTTNLNTVRMTGGSLAYSVDTDTIIGSSGITIEYRGAIIKAASVRACQTTGWIIAEGEVSVRKRELTLTANTLAFNLREPRFRLSESAGNSAWKTFDFGTLKPLTLAEDNGATPDCSTPVNVDSRSWIISERLVLIPREKILFFKVSIYVGDVKLLSMPCYSYEYDSRESILQQIRYTSGDGVLVDLPFYYYQASDSRTGALKLRYAGNGTETGGYYRPRKGLSLGLEQSYFLSEGSRGRFFVDSVGSSNQVFELVHRLEIGPAGSTGRANISVRLQPVSGYGYARDIHNSTVNATGTLGSYYYSFSGYVGGSKIRQFSAGTGNCEYVDQSYCSFRFALSPKVPLISKLFGMLNPSLTTGYGSLWSKTGCSASSRLYESIGVSFNHTGYGAAKTELSWGGSAALTVTSREEAGTSLKVGPTLKARWLGGMVSIGYVFSAYSGITDSVSALSRHQLTGNLFVNSGARWSSYSSLSYGLDSHRLNLYSTLNYNPAGRLQIRSIYNLYRYVNRFYKRPYSFSTSYTKTGIYHPLGPYEIGLAWSPQGQNHGIDKNKRLWLEIGTRGF